MQQKQRSGQANACDFVLLSVTGSQLIYWFHVQVGTPQPIGLNASGNQGNVLSLLKKTKVPHDLCHPPPAEETEGTQVQVLAEHPSALDDGKSESTDNDQAGPGDHWSLSLDFSFHNRLFPIVPLFYDDLVLNQFLFCFHICQIFGANNRSRTDHCEEAEQKVLCPICCHKRMIANLCFRLYMSLGPWLKEPGSLNHSQVPNVQVIST